MFALITPAEGSRRQHPWLTYVLAACLVAAFGAQYLPGEDLERRADGSVAAARAYFEAHPMVALHPRFEVVLGSDWVERYRAARLEALRNQDQLLLSGFLQRRTQEEFDELEEQALVDLASLPVSRLGVAGRETPAPNFLLHVFVSDGGFHLAIALFFLLFAGAAVECRWGALLYSFLCIASVGASAWMAVYLHHELSLPWAGTSGLIGGLLAASLVTAGRRVPQLLGAVPLPGWVLLPLWMGSELLWLGDMPAPGTPPLMAPAAAAGVGLFSALFIGLLLPAQPRLRRAKGSAGPNRAIEHAQRAIANGQHSRAFDLLSAEYQRVPEDPEVALAFWEAARAHGMPGDGAAAILTVMADRVKRGLASELVQIWFDVRQELPDLEIDSAPLVRIAQALLDEGEPDEALNALRRLLDSRVPLSAALALRVIRIARDLDPELAKRAAKIALSDAALIVSDRADLEALVAAPTEEQEQSPDAVSPTAETAVTPLPNGAKLEAMPRIKLMRASASDLERGARGTLPADALPWVARGLVEDLSSELADAEPGDEVAEPAGNSKQVAQDPLLLEDESLAVSAPGPASLEEPELELEDETVEAPATQWEAPGLLDDEFEEDDLSDDTIGMFDGGSAAISSSTPTAVPEPASAGLDRGEARQIKVVPALPLGLEASGIALEIGGKGKIALTWDRVEALAAGAVNGLGDKPILIIDIVLNWMALSSEPLRVIRLRSDQFDPRVLVSGAPSSLEALRSLLSAIVEASGATPLPDADAATGRPFVAFSDLQSYEHAVLGVGNARD